MSNTTLVIYPEETNASRLVGSWLQDFITAYSKNHPFSHRQFNVINSKTPHRLNRNRVEKELGRTNPDVVDILVYYGNGTRCSLSIKGNPYKPPKTRKTLDCDRNRSLDKCNECVALPTGKVLIDTVSIANYLDGKEIYTVACSSAKKLGDDATDFCKKDTAYFGYDDRLPIPGYLDNDTKNKFKNIVNGALEKLHRHSSYPSKIERYRATAKHIMRGFYKLASDIRSERGTDEILGDEVYAVLWRISFRPACKINGVKYTLENLF